MLLMTTIILFLQLALQIHSFLMCCLNIVNGKGSHHEAVDLFVSMSAQGSGQLDQLVLDDERYLHSMDP